MADSNLDQVKSGMAELKGLAERIEKCAADADKPVYMHRDGKGFNQWLGGDEEVIVKRGGQRPGYCPEVPLDYKPFQVWKGVSGGAGRGGFGSFLKDGLKYHRTAEFEQRYKNAAGPLLKALGMSEGIGGDGGFAVLPEYGKNIFEKVYDNDLLSRCDSYSVVGNSMTFPRLNETSRANGSRAGGLNGQWVGESGSIPSSKIGMGTLSLKLKKLAIVVYLTDELIDDAGIALEQYVTRKVTEELNFCTGDAIVEGTGGGQPQGFLNSGALLAVAKQTGQAATTLVKENIDNMYARMWAGSIPNSVWLINQDVWPALDNLNQAVGVGGYPMFIPPGGYNMAPHGTLKGRPIVPIEFASTLGTQGDINFVDLGQYVTISKGGIAQAQSIHVAFLTDELALRFVFRIDGSTWENSPVTPFKGTNTQSSFVTLATRS